ncbi:SHOCT domain-containing protein [Streptomyces sp. JV178]|uniref:SHOCT domain-containing protein n=1 Tax=Streptomyces sp. JV178 TaxID=858632 RepID=UPI000C1AFD6B|nr:SHOCT domain-containing protein [Streptomyces sp. JV178]
MTVARRRARLALTLLGLAIATIGLIIYIPASIDSSTADQQAIDSSAADWAEVLDYEASQETRDAAFEAEQDKRIAEEDKTFGLVLIGLGAAVVASRWAVRPADAATPAPLTAPAPTASVADELAKLISLRDKGVLSETEFEQQKARLLAG